MLTFYETIIFEACKKGGDIRVSNYKKYDAALLTSYLEEEPLTVIITVEKGGCL